MYLAYKERPTPDAWAYPGMMNWSVLPNSSQYGTSQDRVADAVNWETSDRTSINGFYFWKAASQISSSAALLSLVHADIAATGVALEIAVRTSDGVRHLPNWTAGGSKVNHAVTIVGYDDSANPPTYQVMDTCGPGCNSTGNAAAVHLIRQDWLYTLMKADTQDEGVVW